MVLRRVIVSLVLALATGVITACRSKPQVSDQPETSAPPPSAEPSAAESSDPPGETFVGDAGNRFRDAEPKVETADSIDPICTGAEVSFAAVVENPRCTIAWGRAKQLRDAGTLTLKQEAKATSDRRVAFRLINTGTAPLTLPVSHSPKLPAFTAIAEDEQHKLYELEAPRLEVDAHAREKSDAGDGHARVARIVLAPGAAAVATISINTTIVRALTREADSGAPPKLSKGRYRLHIGQLLISGEAGDPAQISWEVP